ncbi:hypothetical protein KIPB_010330, partial [Kipferlia bialata]|eukprot:g10330.t1
MEHNWDAVREQCSQTESFHKYCFFNSE